MSAHHHHQPPHKIEVHLRDLGQLFNSMDPAPFHEKDLDQDAEEFIVSWAHEYHRHEPVALVVHLTQWPEKEDPQPIVEQAVHHYFAYRAKLNWLEFKRLMTQGRQSLFVGLSFLVICLLGGETLVQAEAGSWQSVLKEGLTIVGWVAMWRPLEIYLYDWWPLRRRGQIYEKLSRMEIQVKKRSPAS